MWYNTSVAKYVAANLKSCPTFNRHTKNMSSCNQD